MGRTVCTEPQCLYRDAPLPLTFCVVLKFVHFGKEIRKNTWKVLKCGAGKRREKFSWTDL